MKYLIDTNICIYIMNKRPTGIIHKFKLFDVGEIGVSTITISELQYGVSKSKNRKLNKQRIEEFLSPLEILPYDEIAATIYGDIRVQLEKRGEPIGPLDLLIAAHALSRNLVLISNNEKEFERVKNLKVEDWVK
ncbi:MAG: type II toxin-antitoxin system VapC family toxin [Desulfobacteraceae bacterium]|nr:type II toxin-antitoxin system VapC family toxin [Desulfobacteraceae bacterium]MBC2754861.1 type II toxin-antitoxin system VapC family toxin [Desulfobacteraceae bacterium]